MGNQTRYLRYLYRFSCLGRQAAKLSSCERDRIKMAFINSEVFFFYLGGINRVMCEVGLEGSKDAKKTHFSYPSL
jgi:hypothetical protein